MDLKQLREKLKWIDPFTYVDLYLMPKVNPKENEAVSWIVYLVSAFFFAWVIYTGLGLILGTQSPMMIVVSGSMEPLYHRGDIIILQGVSAEGISGPIVELDEPSLEGKELATFAEPVYKANSKDIEAIAFKNGPTIPVTLDGSIVVYWSEHLQEPIVHRVVVKLKAGNNWYLLTKGDSKQNNTLDQDCGFIINGRPSQDCIELYPIKIEKLQGKALFHLPFLGCAKLWILDDLGGILTKGGLPPEFEQGNIC